jgi:hypothetical protein
MLHSLPPSLSTVSTLSNVLQHRVRSSATPSSVFNAIQVALKNRESHSLEHMQLVIARTITRAIVEPALLAQYCHDTHAQSQKNVDSKLQPVTKMDGFRELQGNELHFGSLFSPSSLPSSLPSFTDSILPLLSEATFAVFEAFGRDYASVSAGIASASRYLRKNRTPRKQKQPSDPVNEPPAAAVAVVVDVEQQPALAPQPTPTPKPPSRSKQLQRVVAASARSAKTNVSQSTRSQMRSRTTRKSANRRT